MHYNYCKNRKVFILVGVCVFSLRDLVTSAASCVGLLLEKYLKLGTGSAVDVNDDNAIKSILRVSPLLHLASWQWFDQDGISL